MAVISKLAQKRIAFFVESGLISKAPTAEQLAKAEKLSHTAAGPLQRVKYYIKNPMQIFPTKAKKDALQRKVALKAMGMMSESGSETRTHSSGVDALDRSLQWLFRISPVRFGVQILFNPYYVVPGSALDTPSKWIIEHTLHSPHLTALWDVQLLLPEPEALDKLRSEAIRCRDQKGVKPRIYRALVQRDSYYDYLIRLIDQVKVFDFPPPPQNYTPHFENLVKYLEFAAELD